MFKPIAGPGSVLAIILCTQIAYGADATDFANRAAAGETSAVQIVEDALARAEEKKALNAFITVDADGARKAASEADNAAEHGPLYGVTIAVKDNFASAGVARGGRDPARQGQHA